MFVINGNLRVKSWEKKLREEALAELPEIFRGPPLPPVSIWTRLWWKIKYPFQFRITHKNNIRNDEDY